MSSTGRLISGSILLYISCTIASAGGIGGGGLNVPILIVVYGFKYQDAVVLSLVTVLGNYISQAFINWNKRHPYDKTRPLIYWNAILCLLPAQLGGSNIGVTIMNIFPETILILIAIAVLIYAVTKTLQKGIKLYHSETNDLMNIKKDDEIPPTGLETMEEEKESLVGKNAINHINTNTNHNYDDHHHSSASNQQLSTPLLADDNEPKRDRDKPATWTYEAVKIFNPIIEFFELYDRKRSSTSSKDLAYSTNNPSTSSLPIPTNSNTTISVVENEDESKYFSPPSPLLKKLNTKGVESKENSSHSYLYSLKKDTDPPIIYPIKIFRILAIVWTIYAGIYVSLTTATKQCSIVYFVILFVTYPPLILLIYWSVRYLIELQHEDPSVIVPGDIIFQSMSYWPPLTAFIIGILCSLLGIGGGELMGPLLLMLKVIPQVSSATTSMMSLFNTSSTILHYGVIGDIPYPWSIFVFIIGLCGGYTGRYSALYITNTYGRASITIFMLSTVLIVSILLLIYHMASYPTDFTFHAFC